MLKPDGKNFILDCNCGVWERGNDHGDHMEMGTCGSEEVVSEIHHAVHKEMGTCDGTVVESKSILWDHTVMETCD